MEAVIEKLAEIERTAEAIVEEAQAQKDAGIPLDPDIIYRRVLKGQCEKELAFAHADLNVERVCILKNRLPESAAKLLRVF